MRGGDIRKQSGGELRKEQLESQGWEVSASSLDSVELLLDWHPYFCSGLINLEHPSSVECSASFLPNGEC